MSPEASAPRSALDWVEPLARAGYTAKGVVYGVVGVLAVRAALGAGGGASGGEGAVREIASGPFGQVLLALLAAGLLGYVAWRLVQAALDPGAEPGDRGAARIGVRLFYLVSGLLYAGLAYFAVDLLLGSGSETGGGGSREGLIAELMSHGWGAWAVGAVGAGMIARGVWQFVKASTERYRHRIESFDLGPARSRWVLNASRAGLTARGVVFGIIGSYMVYAALRHDPSRARGLEGALEALRGRPWMLGVVGAGLCGYAVYQWVKARYRLIGT